MHRRFHTAARIFNLFLVLAILRLTAGPALLKAGSKKPSVHKSAQDTIESSAYVHAPGPDYRPPEGVVYHYRAEWRLLNAGVVSLRMERAADGTEKVTGSADSVGLAGGIFRVHDVFQSQFDPKTFCSLGINKHAEEGARRRETSIRFDYSHGKSVADELNANKNQRRHWENPIPACTLDVLSSLYYTASLPLAPGSSFSFPINDGNKTGNLDVDVTRREQVRTEAGTFSTILVEPQASSEIVKSRGKIWVWYSDDPQRIPVQLRGRLKWGTLTFTLQSIERPAPANR